MIKTIVLRRASAAKKDKPKKGKKDKPKKGDDPDTVLKKKLHSASQLRKGKPSKC